MPASARTDPVLDVFWQRRLTQDLIHDVSHLLSGITLALETLDEGVDALLGEDDRRAIWLARLNACRMHTLIIETVALQRFLDRHGTLRRETFALEPVVRGAFGAPRAGAGVTVHVEGVGPIPLVVGDRALTAELVSALIRTAAHAAQGEPALPLAFQVRIEPQRDTVTTTIQTDRSGPSGADHPSGGPSIDTHGLIYRLSQTALELQGGRLQATQGSHGGAAVSFALPRAS